MSLPMFAGILGVGIGVLLFVYHYYGNQPQTHSHRRYDYSSGSDGQDGPPPSQHCSPAPSDSGGSRRRSMSRNADKSDCIICLEPLSNKSYQLTDCFHRFHTDCLREWKRHSPVCPICRHTINNIC